MPKRRLSQLGMNREVLYAEETVESVGLIGFDSLCLIPGMHYLCAK